MPLSRRHLLGGTALAMAGLPRPGRAAADAITIAWPNDVTSWDPNLRYVPDVQSIFKAVFDQPIMQAPDLRLIPGLLTKWELAPDAMSMAVELRDDVRFHDGSRMTADDFRFTFFDRTRPGQGLDIVTSWRKVSDIEVVSPTRAVMRFSSAAPTAPEWMAFMGSYIVPKNYVSSVGAQEFGRKPIGTGPYRLAEYEMNSRMVLERNENYWGPKAKIGRVTIQVVKDPSARVAAIQSGQVDMTTNVPIREVARLNRVSGLVAEANPATRVILVHCRNDRGFADPRVRLAAHHAIDKAALSQAFFGGAARPLSVFATPGSPGDVPDFRFPFDIDKAKALLAEAGFGPDKPARVGFATTNGHFPGDYDIARAMVQMWKRVGIEADLQVIEYAKYFELNRGGQLPELTLYAWENATADPEIYIGYMMNPNMAFSPSKDPEIGRRTLALFDTANYEERIAGYRRLEQDAVEQGLSLPLLQSVVTVVRKRELGYEKYGNGWLLPQSMTWG
ncbi:ABC transporter substrate-binding protein [Roseomonas sp. BN140053]|uniref:ABC transporter substrate-binding protein n=1 Tax=Roseomonas sp. BN140053 TaxID=3391898 RepID=UPI0039E7B624